MAATTIYIHIHDGDQLHVEPSAGHVKVDIGDRGALFLPAEQARTLAAHLLAAAEYLDPDTADLDQIRRTLAIATGGAA